ncbi:MAG: AAA family ATPase [Devosia sp.]
MTSQPGRLIIICGLPGTGKTTLANALAERHRGIIFSPDIWMNVLSIDLWSLRGRRAVEQLQWQVARDVIRAGGTAIMEWGTWSRAERDTLREGARAVGAAVELAYLTAPPEVLFERISRRARENPPITLDMLREWSSAIEVPTEAELALYDPPIEADK